MSVKRRFDGTMIKVPSFSRMMLFVMPRKSDAVVYFEHEVDVTDTLEYVHEINRELTKRKSVLTLFEVVMCAAVRTIVERPRLNRFVSDYHFYQRNRIEFSFVAKKELTDDGEEVTVKIPYSPLETLESMAIKTKRFIRQAVSGDGMTTEKIIDFVARLPNWMVKLISGSVDFLDAKRVPLGDLVETDPMWCSIFFTNVGSFNLDAPYHHLYNRGNCPLFVSVGVVRTVSETGPDGVKRERKKLTLRYTCDERISEGLYMAKALELMKGYIENPRPLAEAPVIGEVAMAELAIDPSTYSEN